MIISINELVSGHQDWALEPTLPLVVNIVMDAFGWWECAPGALQRAAMVTVPNGT